MKKAILVSAVLTAAAVLSTGGNLAMGSTEVLSTDSSLTMGSTENETSGSQVISWEECEAVLNTFNETHGTVYAFDRGEDPDDSNMKAFLCAMTAEELNNYLESAQFSGMTDEDLNTYLEKLEGGNTLGAETLSWEECEAVLNTFNETHGTSYAFEPIDETSYTAMQEMFCNMSYEDLNMYLEGLYQRSLRSGLE
jgi:hypothetical protein